VDVTLNTQHAAESDIPVHARTSADKRIGTILQIAHAINLACHCIRLYLPTANHRGFVSCD
jgi:hypothetical protein